MMLLLWAQDVPAARCRETPSVSSTLLRDRYPEVLALHRALLRAAFAACTGALGRGVAPGSRRISRGH